MCAAQIGPRDDAVGFAIQGITPGDGQVDDLVQFAVVGVVVVEIFDILGPQVVGVLEGPPDTSHTSSEPASHPPNPPSVVPETAPYSRPPERPFSPVILSHP